MTASGKEEREGLNKIASTVATSGTVAFLVYGCLLPMAAWLVTIFCMTRYSLSGEKMREVQAVNAVRKAAVQGGMSMAEAMATCQTIDQVPERFVQQVDKRTRSRASSTACTRSISPKPRRPAACRPPRLLRSRINRKERSNEIRSL